MAARRKSASVAMMSELMQLSELMRVKAMRVLTPDCARSERGGGVQYVFSTPGHLV